DLLEERTPLVEVVPEMHPDLLDGLRGNRRRAYDGRDPADLPLQLGQNGTLTADRRPGIRRFDRHLAGLRLEVEGGDLRLGRNQFANGRLRFLRILQGG